MIDKFTLDGVNLDWGKINNYVSSNKSINNNLLEYPNDPNGVSCNIK